MRRRLALVVFATAGALLLPGTAALAAPAAGVDPSTVDVTLLPGHSTTITKNVTTSPIPANPDLVLLADTTGSMGPAIDNVKENASDVTSAASSCIVSAPSVCSPTAADGARCAHRRLVSAHTAAKRGDEASSGALEPCGESCPLAEGASGSVGCSRRECG